MSKFDGMANTMQETPPRHAYRHDFRNIEDIFYGTDDGCEDGSFGEFAKFEDFYTRLEGERKRDIHLVSVVGGFYGLNLIPLFRPKRITLFDMNPHQITYGNLIIRVLTSSLDADDFLRRLTNKDYEVYSDQERTIREAIAMKQNGPLPTSRGRSKRSFSSSWKYALEHFDLTKRVLSEAVIETRVEGMQEKSFQDYVRDKKNIWIYTSNIFLFVNFKLEFSCPRNVVLMAVHLADTYILDLTGEDLGPREVHYGSPMTARRLVRE